ncbi:MAG: aminopeptidase P family protein [Pirellulales bacterium]
MNRLFRFSLVLVAIVVNSSGLLGQEMPYYQTDFPPEEFKARWARLYEEIGTNAVAIVQGMAQVRGFNLPRQTNEFYYLCGIDTPHSYIVLDGQARRAILYLPDRNRRLESAEGRVLSASDVELVQRLTGADEVLPTSEMREDRMAAVLAAESIFTPFQPAEGYAESRGEIISSNRRIQEDYWDGRPTRENNFRDLLAKRFPKAKIQDLTPTLDSMRNIKSPREIAMIRRASQLSGLGLIEAIKSTRPGVYEYQLDAACRYHFIVNGSRLDGYRPITASGTDTIINMHYFRNSAALKDGDLVLMDYAPDYGYYVSDVGRMWPVNGKFAPWQRELCQFVLDYRNAVMQRIRPGVSPRQIQSEAAEAMQAVFARTKFSKPIYEEACINLVERGGGVFSHGVGMAVHDVGTRGYQGSPLRPGFVFSVDPQLRVPQERLYIRIEDVVVVTESGVENFTAFLPTELDDIEKLVGKNGIVQQFPPQSVEEVLNWKMPPAEAAAGQ